MEEERILERRRRKVDAECISVGNKMQNEKSRWGIRCSMTDLGGEYGDF
jgi:hypothetical protein